jgi:hypothetical protein
MGWWVDYSFQISKNYPKVDNDRGNVPHVDEQSGATTIYSFSSFLL